MFMFVWLETVLLSARAQTFLVQIHVHTMCLEHIHAHRSFLSRRKESSRQYRTAVLSFHARQAVLMVGHLVVRV